MVRGFSPRKRGTVIQLKHVLVATDFGDAAGAALRYGTELARSFDATLHVLHVVDDLGAHATTPGTAQLNLGQLQTALEEEAQEALDRLVGGDDQSGVAMRAHLLTSPRPAKAILDFARDQVIDLIVVGTQGRTGVAHMLLGSVAEKVVRSAPCPVLTVRHPEHEFLRPDALQASAQSS